MSYLERSVNLLPWFVRDNIRKVPGIAYLQRLVFNTYLAGRRFKYTINAGPAKGLNLAITLPDDKLLWTGTWEKEIADLIAQSVPIGSIALDVGAHRGFFGGVMALNGARQVWAFEPNPGNVAALNGLLELNPELPIEVLPVAVTDHDGTAMFDLMPEDTMGKLSGSEFQYGVDSEAKFKVEVRSLDSLLAERNWQGVGIIKIDVEGAELSVLKGATTLLTTWQPLLVIEIHTFKLLQECTAFLNRYGYQTRIVESGIHPDEESSFKVCHLEAICTT